MGRFITVRRLGGLALALAGLAGISAGILTGSTAYLVFGMVAWWLLVFGGVAALLQRASMLMRMVAATRADLETLASWQQRHPGELWKQLARIEKEHRRAVGQAQDETVRLRKETKRGLAVLERSLAMIAEEQSGAATVNAANQLSLVSALVDATSNQRTAAVELESVKTAIGGIPVQLCEAQAGVLQAQADVLQAQADAAQETRRSLMEHSSLAMRVYRDIHSELDARQGPLDEAVKQLGRQAGAIVELKSVLDGVDNRLQETGKSVEATSKGLEATSKGIEATTKSIEAASKGIEATSKGIEATSKSLEELRADYEGDKRKLKALSRDEKQLRSISRRGLQWLKYETVREVEAVLQLRQILQVDLPTPLLGGWAMDPESVYGLVQLLLERRPRLVVELGSGASTVWVALALRRIGAGRIISYDHLPEYADRTRDALRSAGLEEWAEVRDAPLADVTIGDATYPWYSIGEAGKDAPIDMLMVDGPPASTGPLARYPAVPQFFGALGEGGIVVVDDATRADEEEMLERWSQEFPRLKPADSLGPRTVVLALEPAPAAAGADNP
ncbi:MULTISPECIES: class I SAM-dependent methyltransferase [unclassified Luteimonas]